MPFELPKDWMVKALEILKEVSEIIELVKRSAEKVDMIEVEVAETKRMVSEIKERTKKLLDKLPAGWVKQ